MDLHTEALHSLLLLEDTLDTEVDRLEEELSWNRQKFVYLQALGCAASDLADVDRTIQRSEGMINTLKQLLQQTFQDRLKCAEKVELQLELSRRVSSPFNHSIQQPPFHLCDQPCRYCHHHSLQQQTQALTRTERDTEVRQATNDRIVLVRNRASLAMKSTVVKESSTCPLGCLLLSAKPKHFNTANRGVYKLCLCKPNIRHSSFHSTRVQTKKSLKTVNLFSRSRQGVFQTLQAKKQYNLMMQRFKKNSADKTKSKNRDPCVSNLHHQRGMKGDQKPKMQDTDVIPEIEKVNRGIANDVPNILNSSNQNIPERERNTTMRLPNLASADIGRLVPQQNHLLPESEMSPSSRDTSGQLATCLYHCMDLGEEMLNELSARQG